MTTNFFKQLSELGITGLGIEIKTSEDGLVSVVTSPRSVAKDQALKSLVPILLTGTPDEIDQHYFESISGPMKKTKEFFHNVEEYEKSVEVAKANTAAEKDRQDKEKNKKKLEKEAVKKLQEFTEKLDAEGWLKNQTKVKSLVEDVFKINKSNSKAKATLDYMKIQIAKASLGGGLFQMDSNSQIEESKALAAMNDNSEDAEEESLVEESEKEDAEESYDHEDENEEIVE